MSAFRQAYDESAEGWSASCEMPAPEGYLQLSEVICLYGPDTEGLNMSLSAPTSSTPSMPTPSSNPQELQTLSPGQTNVPNTAAFGAPPEPAPQPGVNVVGNPNVSLPPGAQVYQTQYSNFAPSSQNYSSFPQPDVSTPRNTGSIPPTPSNQETVSGAGSQTQQKSTNSDQPEPKQEKKKCGSCCCHKEDSTEEAGSSKNTGQGTSSPPQFNSAPFSPIDGQPMVWKQGAVASPGNPIPMHHYVFNSAQNPSQGIMSGFQIPHPTSATPQTTYTLQRHPNNPNNFGQNPGGHYFPHGMSEHRLGAPSIFSYDPAHNCNCGDGCQCLGCASHPYNSTTRQHIQAMGYMMTMGDDDTGSEPSRSRGQTVYDGQMSPTPTQFPSFPNNGLNYAQTPGPEHPQTFSGHAPTPGFEHNPQTPGSASYDNGYTQMLMQPSAYYTVEYPVADVSPCTDMTGTCQCGSDCSCVGCLTHSGHNGLSLGSPQHQSTSNAQTTSAFPPQHGMPYIQSQEHMSPLDYTADSPESQIPVDPNPV
ncbi:hypothetical protein FQN54_009029 [Arachnomyces sp. PD_36]|nr:hypothetical protein FQN54_009029 [Arachnomyces sp. PD_36]